MIGVGLVCWATGVELTPLWIALAGLFGLAVWCRLLPVSFGRFVAEPLRRGRIRRQLRRLWPWLMDSCGLVEANRVNR